MNDIEKAEMLLNKAYFPFLPWVVQFLPTGPWLMYGYEEDTIQSLAQFLYATNLDRFVVKFDENYKWPYPPETREGVPVWAKIKTDIHVVWLSFSCLEHMNDLCSAEYWAILEIVAADPRSPQQPPPNDLPPPPKG